MNLFRITRGQLAFGDHALLDKADFHINKGEKICILGRNGAGKSTLMKVIAGEQLLDDGDLNLKSSTRISRLPQDPPKASQGTAYEYAALGLGEVGEVLGQYYALSMDANCDLNKLSDIQHRIDQLDGWTFEPKIQQVLSRLGLSPDLKLNSLSGGWLRKVALAQALVVEPDILLLDEPTNHLDYQSIDWLEKFLNEYNGALVFISHDRAFVRNVAKRIVDLDRGKLTSFDRGYDSYLEEKVELLRVEEEQNKQFDIKLSQEEAWIRQGVKARRTRNEGRVRDLKKLRQERSERRNVQGKAKLNLEDANKSGKLVAEICNLGYAFDKQTIVKNFNSLIMRGDKLALIGPNGCGKSTFIKLIMGALEPQEGEVKVGTKLEIAYFDQYRSQLDEEKSVIDNVADGKQDVIFNGQTRHALGYLQDFLFAPQRARSPVKSLSGGEKNRLLLAKLFLKPANLLILDEPTNDLDVETLELLEELISSYKGTMLLVSHDREFVNNTATSSYFFHGEGYVEEFVGGYEVIIPHLESLEASRKQQAKGQIKAQTTAQTTKSEPTANKTVEKPQSSKVKLSYKQRLLLESLPQKIEELEALVESIQSEVNQPEFFNLPQSQTAVKLQALADAEAEFEQAFEQWEALESLQNNS